MQTRHQVIIVGGGPVGVALAVELGMRGISCALIERRTKLQEIPKGQNLTQRTLEHFYFWGIVDELRAARVMPPGYPIGERDRVQEPDERILACAAWPRDRAAILFPGQRTAAAVPDRSGAAREDGVAFKRR